MRVRVYFFGKENDITPRERELLQRMRLFSVELSPLRHSRHTDAALAQAEEASRAEKAIGGRPYWALDERGERMTSERFSREIITALETEKELTMVIGGAAGLTPSLREGAMRVLSFSPMVWTHDLVRLMLTEQLYRAQEIHRGSAFHK